MSGRAIAIAACLTAIAAFAWWRASVPSPAPPADIAGNTAASRAHARSSAVLDVDDAASQDAIAATSTTTSRAPALDRSQQLGAHRAEHESGEAPLTLSWDALAPNTRVRQLRRDLDAALAELERSDDPEQRNNAQASLTALRGELYATASGRALHRDYETRLERLTAEGE